MQSHEKLFSWKKYFVRFKHFEQDDIVLFCQSDDLSFNSIEIVERSAMVFDDCIV